MKKILLGLFILGALCAAWIFLPLKVAAPERGVASAMPIDGGATEPTHPNAAPAMAAAADKKTLLQQISDTNKCYESEACDFPKTDPRSYEFAVGKKLAEQLKVFRAAFEKDLAAQTDLEILGRTYVKSYDGFVQEEALKILALFPPSRENMDAIIAGLENIPDPLIVEQAMGEMKRYLGSPEEALVQEFLSKLIANGGQFSSEKASELILPFLNASSLPIFQKALENMVPDSIAARNLKIAIDEYMRQQSGA